jgi:hypothetical protein
MDGFEEELTSTGIARSAKPAGSDLLQFRVFGLSLLKDGQARIGVFPQREEIFVRPKCACTRKIGVSPMGGFGD